MLEPYQKYLKGYGYFSKQGRWHYFRRGGNVDDGAFTFKKVQVGIRRSYCTYM